MERKRERGTEREGEREWLLITRLKCCLYTHVFLSETLSMRTSSLIIVTIIPEKTNLKEEGLWIVASEDSDHSLCHPLFLRQHTMTEQNDSPHQSQEAEKA